MPVMRIDEPSETQYRFLRAKAKHVAFGGARGGGKSWCARTKAKLLSVKYGGIKCLIVRKTYTNRITSTRSSEDIVAASPVVPQTMMASVPLMICSSMSRVRAV